MKKLITWLRWIDDNLVHIAIIAFIFATAVVPKIPLQSIEYTYIKFRIDDLFPAVLGIIFIIQWLRRKIVLNTKFLWLFIAFWAAVFLSFIFGYYVQHTIPQQSIGLLHSLRRVEYMFIFFVASSTITSRERFFQYMKLYFIALFIVGIYGIGQKFLSFPSIQSMNPAYVDGRLLFLKPYDRINSTFGGHFDLAAYITFSLPLLIGFYFFKKQIRYMVLFFFSLLILLYTAMRSSFLAYGLTIPPFLLLTKKFKILIIVLVMTAVMTYATGQMIKRFQETFQSKNVYENTLTGGTQIDQKITAKNLPAGQATVPVIGNVIQKISGNTSTANPVAPSDPKVRSVAINEAIAEAKANGVPYNGAAIQNRANEIAKHIVIKKTVLCDISCSTRLQVEWPRAASAFLYNPLLGSGPSSITEATDNDILRWFGETGLLGAGLFFALLFAISRYVLKAKKYVEGNEKLIYTAFVVGLVASLLNAMYVDIFEASKFAYNFWLVAGFYVGMTSVITSSSSHGKKTPHNAHKS